jgi:tetratricopeptide (TPR) repeat protein
VIDPLDIAIEAYERALAKRDAGDHQAALALVESALEPLEGSLDPEVAVTRARLAITRADLATRVRPGDVAIAIANEAVVRAKQVADAEPLVEASALYMLGKAQRVSRAHRFGADSFERSLAIFRAHTGDSSVETADAAGSVGLAHLRLGEWERAMVALDIVIDADPDGPELVHVLNRAVVGERLGALDRAQADIEDWIGGAFARPPYEQLRGHLCASRVYATRGNLKHSAEQLVLAHRLALGQLPPRDPRWAQFLEGHAWNKAARSMLLEAEVAMRRAIALSDDPSILDTANRIAALWRPGVEETLAHLAFAVLEVDAALMLWQAEGAYVPKQRTHDVRFLVVGLPASIERLTSDAAWRSSCVQRLFSVFHGRQFKSERDPNFVSPASSNARVAEPTQILEKLPQLRVPFWATTKAVAITAHGELEELDDADIALAAITARGHTGAAATAALMRAVPGFEVEMASKLVADVADLVVTPPRVIPGYSSG